MYTSVDRKGVHQRVLAWAESDTRVVAGAVVGSLAQRIGDRWSDLDLTFAVEDGVPIGDVLDQWSDRLADEFEAVRLFDLPADVHRTFSEALVRSRTGSSY